MKTLLIEIEGREFFVLVVLLILTICFIHYNAAAAMRGAVAQSVERATPDEHVPGSIPAVAARSLLVLLMSV